MGDYSLGLDRALERLLEQTYTVVPLVVLGVVVVVLALSLLVPDAERAGERAAGAERRVGSG